MQAEDDEQPTPMQCAAVLPGLLEDGLCPDELLEGLQQLIDYCLQPLIAALGETRQAEDQFDEASSGGGSPQQWMACLRAILEASSSCSDGGLLQDLLAQLHSSVFLHPGLGEQLCRLLGETVAPSSSVDADLVALVQAARLPLMATDLLLLSCIYGACDLSKLAAQQKLQALIENCRLNDLLDMPMDPEEFPDTCRWLTNVALHWLEAPSKSVGGTHSKAASQQPDQQQKSGGSSHTDCAVKLLNAMLWRSGARARHITRQLLSRVLTGDTATSAATRPILVSVVEHLHAAAVDQGAFSTAAGTAALRDPASAAGTSSGGGAAAAAAALQPSRRDPRLSGRSAALVQRPRMQPYQARPPAAAAWSSEEQAQRDATLAHVRMHAAYVHDALCREVHFCLATLGAHAQCQLLHLLAPLLPFSEGLMLTFLEAAVGASALANAATLASKAASHTPGRATAPATGTGIEKRSFPNTPLHGGAAGGVAARPTSSVVSGRIRPPGVEGTSSPGSALLGGARPTASGFTTPGSIITALQGPSFATAGAARAGERGSGRTGGAHGHTPAGSSLVTGPLLSACSSLCTEDLRLDDLDDDALSSGTPWLHGFGGFGSHGREALKILPHSSSRQEQLNLACDVLVQLMLSQQLRREQVQAQHGGSQSGTRAAGLPSSSAAAVDALIANVLQCSRHHQAEVYARISHQLKLLLQQQARSSSTQRQPSRPQPASTAPCAQTITDGPIHDSDDEYGMQEDQQQQAPDLALLWSCRLLSVMRGLLMPPEPAPAVDAHFGSTAEGTAGLDLAHAVVSGVQEGASLSHVLKCLTASLALLPRRAGGAVSGDVSDFGAGSVQLLTGHEQFDEEAGELLPLLLQQALHGSPWIRSQQQQQQQQQARERQGRPGAAAAAAAAGGGEAHDAERAIAVLQLRLQLLSIFTALMMDEPMPGLHLIAPAHSVADVISSCNCPVGHDATHATAAPARAATTSGRSGSTAIAAAADAALSHSGDASFRKPSDALACGVCPALLQLHGASHGAEQRGAGTPAAAQRLAAAVTAFQLALLQRHCQLHNELLMLEEQAQVQRSSEARMASGAHAPGTRAAEEGVTAAAAAGAGAASAAEVHAARDAAAGPAEDEAAGSADIPDGFFVRHTAPPKGRTAADGPASGTPAGRAAAEAGSSVVSGRSDVQAALWLAPLCTTACLISALTAQLQEVDAASGCCSADDGPPSALHPVAEGAATAQQQQQQQGPYQAKGEVRALGTGSRGSSCGWGVLLHALVCTDQQLSLQRYAGGASGLEHAVRRQQQAHLSDLADALTNVHVVCHKVMQKASDVSASSAAASGSPMRLHHPMHPHPRQPPGPRSLAVGAVQAPAGTASVDAAAQAATAAGHAPSSRTPARGATITTITTIASPAPPAQLQAQPGQQQQQQAQAQQAQLKSAAKGPGRELAQLTNSMVIFSSRSSRKPRGSGPQDTQPPESLPVQQQQQQHQTQVQPQPQPPASGAPAVAGPASQKKRRREQEQQQGHEQQPRANAEEEREERRQSHAHASTSGSVPLPEPPNPAKRPAPSAPPTAPAPAAAAAVEVLPIEVPAAAAALTGAGAMECATAVLPLLAVTLRHLLMLERITPLAAPAHHPMGPPSRTRPLSPRQSGPEASLSPEGSAGTWASRVATSLLSGVSPASRSDALSAALRIVQPHYGSSAWSATLRAAAACPVLTCCLCLMQRVLAHISHASHASLAAAAAAQPPQRDGVAAAAAAALGAGGASSAYVSGLLDLLLSLVKCCPPSEQQRKASSSEMDLRRAVSELALHALRCGAGAGASEALCEGDAVALLTLAAGPWSSAGGCFSLAACVVTTCGSSSRPESSASSASYPICRALLPQDASLMLPLLRSGGAGGWGRAALLTVMQQAQYWLMRSAQQDAACEESDPELRQLVQQGVAVLLSAASQLLQEPLEGSGALGAGAGGTTNAAGGSTARCAVQDRPRPLSAVEPCLSAMLCVAKVVASSGRRLYKWLESHRQVRGTALDQATGSLAGPALPTYEANETVVVCGEGVRHDARLMTLGIAAVSVAVAVCSQVRPSSPSSVLSRVADLKRLTAKCRAFSSFFSSKLKGCAAIGNVPGGGAGFRSVGWHVQQQQQQLQGLGQGPWSGGRGLGAPPAPPPAYAAAVLALRRELQCAAEAILTQAQSGPVGALPHPSHAGRQQHGPYTHQQQHGLGAGNGAAVMAHRAAQVMRAPPSPSEIPLEPSPMGFSPGTSPLGVPAAGAGGVISKAPGGAAAAAAAAGRAAAGGAPPAAPAAAAGGKSGVKADCGAPPASRPAAATAAAAAAAAAAVRAGPGPSTSGRVASGDATVTGAGTSRDKALQAAPKHAVQKRKRSRNAFVDACLKEASGWGGGYRGDDWDDLEDFIVCQPDRDYEDLIAKRYKGRNPEHSDSEQDEDEEGGGRARVRGRARVEPLPLDQQQQGQQQTEQQQEQQQAMQPPVQQPQKAQAQKQQQAKATHAQQPKQQAMQQPPPPQAQKQQHVNKTQTQQQPERQKHAAQAKQVQPPPQQQQQQAERSKPQTAPPLKQLRSPTKQQQPQQKQQQPALTPAPDPGPRSSSRLAAIEKRKAAKKGPAATAASAPIS